MKYPGWEHFGGQLIMNLDRSAVIVLAGFVLLALASKQVGQFLTRFKLPLISGFLLAGILVGPYGFGFIQAGDLESLEIVDEIALAFIAFAAGSELYLRELRSRVKSILFISAGIVLAVSLLIFIALFFMSEAVPFMQAFPVTGRLAIASLAAAILVARSPSSAIAIVNEVRARGPFTQTVLGVTVVMDFVVIVLFAINIEIADALLAGIPVNLGFAGLILFELFLSVVLAVALAGTLQLIMSTHLNSWIKIALILLAGLSIFFLSSYIRSFSHEHLSAELFLEPLLICLVASLLINNRSSYRTEFLNHLSRVAPPIYVIFFTLTGAALALDVLKETWWIALALFMVRMVGLFIGSYAGGVAAGEPRNFNLTHWLTAVTMAGVGLGLAKEVDVEFSTWGGQFATLIIAVIVLSQLVGPPLFKWAINFIGEAHPRHDTPEFDGVNDAIIFGIDGQSIALAQQLHAHGWNVRVACLDKAHLNGSVTDLAVVFLDDFSVSSLRSAGAENAEAIVAMLSDDENYQIAELAYENFGTSTIVVRLNDRANFQAFHRLGVLIVDPATVMVGLMDHFVRSPSAASLLVGMEEGQDVVEIEIRNKDLDGIFLRELRMPLDTLVLNVQRDGHALISHGFTRLRCGDRLTVVGSLEGIDELMLKFDSQDG